MQILLTKANLMSRLSESTKLHAKICQNGIIVQFEEI